MVTWISAEEARRRLGVRTQTLYAYVSRGKLGVMPDAADTRRSLYRAEDVDMLADRKKADRKHETVAAGTLFGAQPSMPTALCGFFQGRPHYRGHDAIALARGATLEEVAQLLWNSEKALALSAPAHEPERAPGRAAMFEVLAALAAEGHSTHARMTRVLHAEAQVLVGHVAQSYGAREGDEPLHVRLARGWRQPPRVAEPLRQAMVLLADHELTSSAFVARISASTGASLPACLLAGLATLSGPSHGDASGRVHALFGEVERLGAEQVIRHHLGSGLSFAGFGHHLYPDGDPRAAALLAMFDPPRATTRFLDRVTAATGLQPNVDAALAALAARYRLPPDAAFGLLAIARSVGLLAHSLEQLAVEQVIRPRGRYVGQIPGHAS